MLNFPTRLRTVIMLCLLSTLTMPTIKVQAKDHPVPEEFAYCTVCHGTLFRGNKAAGAPRLLGLSEWYIASQLASFSNGKRGKHGEDLAGLEMQPMAEILTIKSQMEISKLISELPTISLVASDDYSGGTSIESIEKGRQLYSSCGVCHGVDGTGTKLMGAPNLVVQNDWYLMQQLDNYRNEIRGTSPDDERGLQMSAATTTLKTDQDVSAVIAYIRSMRGS